jgi:glycosyltransferase involved in cell wall biosynthesis
LGWVDHTRLPDIYSNADILLLPSRFDTFSCVVLEAMSCGLPVVAYKTKGPKDIIQHNKNGFLVKTKEEFAVAAAEYLNAPEHHNKMRASAIKRAGDYNAELIMNKLLTDTGLSSE